MIAPKKLFAAALAALPLFAFGQTPATEPAKPAEPAPAATPATTPPPAAPAAAAAAPAPAFQIYGTLNVNAQYTRAVGANPLPATATGGATPAPGANPAVPLSQDVAGRTALSVDSSNIGIRGTLDLGKWGLKGTYQCETAANVDGQGVSGICNRNSRVGVTSAYGTLFYGNWDTPLKASAYGTKAEDPFGNTDVFAFQSILGSPGFNTRSGSWKQDTTAAVTSFDLRAGNSIGFQSAKFMGASFKVQYSPNEFGSANGRVNPELYSAVVNYDNGPLSAFAAGELHTDAYGLFGINGVPLEIAGIPASGAPTGTRWNFGATANSPRGTDTWDFVWRVGAGYELASPFGATTVSGAYEQLEFHQPTPRSATTGAVVGGALTEYTRFAWQVGLKHRMGGHEFRARYSMADAGDCKLKSGAACSTADYGASDVALGYAYFFTKSFQGYLTYTQIFNEDNAQYTFSIGGSNSGIASTATTQAGGAVAGATGFGADPMAVALGVRYAF